MKPPDRLLAIKAWGYRERNRRLLGDTEVTTRKESDRKERLQRWSTILTRVREHVDEAVYHASLERAIAAGRERAIAIERSHAQAREEMKVLADNVWKSRAHIREPSKASKSKDSRPPARVEVVEPAPELVPPTPVSVPAEVPQIEIEGKPVVESVLDRIKRVKARQKLVNAGKPGYDAEGNKLLKAPSAPAASSSRPGSSNVTSQVVRNLEALTRESYVNHGMLPYESIKRLKRPGKK